MKNCGLTTVEILKTAKGLKGKSINSSSGDIGNTDAFNWSDVNTAMWMGAKVPPSKIFTVLQKIK